MNYLALAERLFDRATHFVGDDNQICLEAVAALREAHAELMEQARCNGMGGERELALMAEVSRLRALLREARKDLLLWCDCHDIMPDETAEVVARIDAELKEEQR